MAVSLATTKGPKGPGSWPPGLLEEFRRGAADPLEALSVPHRALSIVSQCLSGQTLLFLHWTTDLFGFQIQGLVYAVNPCKTSWGLQWLKVTGRAVVLNVTDTRCSTW